MGLIVEGLIVEIQCLGRPNSSTIWKNAIGSTTMTKKKRGGSGPPLSNAMVLWYGYRVSCYGMGMGMGMALHAVVTVSTKL